MKSKVVFLLFNAILVFSFAFVFLMPVFVFGFPVASEFWAGNWPVFCGFLLVLILMDGYFISRRHFFRLLETENWPGLASYLEEETFTKNRLSDRNIRFLFRAWLVQGKLSESRRLEEMIRERKPALLARHARMLGLRHLVENDPADLVAWFGPHAGLKGSDGPWLSFGLAVGLAGSGKIAESRVILKALATGKVHPLLRLVALYMVGQPQAGEDPEGLVTAKKDFLRSTGRKEVERMRDQTHEDLEILVLGKILDEAVEWVYA